MTEYAPTTEEVRQAITYGEPAWGPMFDRWLAAHDAEVLASVLAEQGEPEWEYAWEADEAVRSELRPRGPRVLLDDQPGTPEALAHFPKGRRIRRRKAGPWLPVEEGETP